MNEDNPEHSVKLPAYQFLHDDFSKINPTGKQLYGNAVVMQSLPIALYWLRDCAKENPNVRLQVRTLMIVVNFLSNQLLCVTSMN